MPAPENTLSSLARVRPVPGWARVKGALATEADSFFHAGASLAALDAFLRTEPVFAGVWRQRLAITAAAATVRLVGRREDVGALRDGWCFRASDSDPGPSGHILKVWRQLAQSRSRWSGEDILKAAAAFGIDLRGGEGELATRLEVGADGDMSVLRTVIELTDSVVAQSAQAELLALMLADRMLASIMGWPVPVPLLMTQIGHAILRVGEPRRRPRPGEGGWPRTLATIYALAATAALDLACDLERRAHVLRAAVPKLRAKQAGAVIMALLDDDALTPSMVLGAMSDRAQRRLFDRLVDLGAVRELSGRATFRLYGL
ncbi:DUF1403 family protein [Labrys sp. KB_33_2]